MMPLPLPLAVGRECLVDKPREMPSISRHVTVFLRLGTTSKINIELHTKFLGQHVGSHLFRISLILLLSFSGFHRHSPVLFKLGQQELINAYKQAVGLPGWGTKRIVAVIGSHS